MHIIDETVSSETNDYPAFSYGTGNIFLPIAQPCCKRKRWSRFGIEVKCSLLLDCGSSRPDYDSIDGMDTV